MEYCTLTSTIRRPHPSSSYAPDSNRPSGVSPTRERSSTGSLIVHHRCTHQTVRVDRASARNHSPRLRERDCALVQRRPCGVPEDSLSIETKGAKTGATDMLSEFIALNRDEIIRCCRAKVATRSIPTPSQAEINHGVPLFLDQLV